jgi:hypothetical protein
MTQWGLDSLFNPAKRHMDEEKRRLQSTREEIGDSSGGNRIDFESGKVTIRMSSKPKAEADEIDDELAEVSDASDMSDSADDVDGRDGAEHNSQAVPESLPRGAGTTG